MVRWALGVCIAIILLSSLFAITGRGNVTRYAHIVDTHADGDADTPLMQAAADGDATRVKKLLASKHTRAEIDRALIRGAQSQRVAVVLALLKAGAAPNAYWEGETPLMAATSVYSSGSHVGVARALLTAGADKDATGDCFSLDEGPGVGHACTPLIEAAATADPNTVRLLIDTGANRSALDSAGHGALWYANRSSSNTATVARQKTATIVELKAAGVDR